MISKFANNENWWCVKTREKMAEEMWITKKSVLNLIKKLIEKWFIEKNEETKFLKTTRKWLENMVFEK
jgi:predicted transcriptional regulator